MACLKTGSSICLKRTTRRREGAEGRREKIPGSRKLCLASGRCNFDKTRPWLGLVDLSRIQTGTFFSGGPSWLGDG